ncbi:MAG: YraN family protein [Chitinophagaceae bacterium]|nr:YraN family protein [Chitinophagaceae bacterium]
MAKHLETGKEGEEMAAAWLLGQGFTILHRNWKHSYFELDVIAEREGVLHFIEVKTRTTDTYGHPEEGVTAKKLERLMNAGEEFLNVYPVWERIHYDILSIRLYSNKAPEYFFIEDVS